MALIAGFDISNNFGFALWDTKRPKSEIMTACVRLAKHDHGGEMITQIRSGKVATDFVRKYTPDFVVIEALIRGKMKSHETQLDLGILHGAVCSHLWTLKIPFGTIAVASWRTALYGKNWKDALPMLETTDQWGRPVYDADGTRKIHRMTEKEKAVAECGLLGIELPSGKDLAHNAAEAALVAMAFRVKTMRPEGHEAMRRYTQIVAAM